MVKKQQMQWIPEGAHLLLQTRTRVLNDELEDLIRQWHPNFRPRAVLKSMLPSDPRIVMVSLGETKLLERREAFT